MFCSNIVLVQIEDNQLAVFLSVSGCFEHFLCKLIPIISIDGDTAGQTIDEDTSVNFLTFLLRFGLLNRSSSVITLRKNATGLFTWIIL